MSLSDLFLKIKPKCLRNWRLRFVSDTAIRNGLLAVAIEREEGGVEEGIRQAVGEEAEEDAEGVARGKGGTGAGAGKKGTRESSR